MTRNRANTGTDRLGQNNIVVLHRSLTDSRNTGTYVVRPLPEYHNINNLVPRAHVPFGQHQDTELWNNKMLKQATGTMILLVYVGSMW